MVAADQRAVELHGGAAPVGGEGELHGEALARLPGHQAAEVAAQGRGQHGLGEQRQVQARRAPPGLLLDGAVVVDEVRHVGDVHVGAVAVAVALHADGVVEVAGRVGVDGERGQRREVVAAVVRARGARAHRGRLVKDLGAEALRQPPRVDHGAQHGAQIVGAPQHLDDATAVAVHRHGEHQIVELRGLAALGDEAGARVGEQRLERPELAPAGDAVREGLRRSGRAGLAGALAAARPRCSACGRRALPSGRPRLAS